ncbi:tetratricopeptide repeat protein [Streptomyces sp. NPDC051104]|uniref:tetratricopeptide repeat protein n=1 Tax=Streptomyces sp. NPDC051104 TaxID=3155044 RepID=UPI0034263963
MNSDACDEVTELPCAIGFLERSTGRLVEARRILEPLHDDRYGVYGPDDEDTMEITDVLARIRLTLDDTHREAPET